ncbi:hypothetical protein GCK32_013153 [Trichostrongylus colubriformis]|uniref:Secreted protein n=1 Tax=Trichostrongylus colubriformis TaxID=6319 RepID=A0AAN8F685_TRICO
MHWFILAWLIVVSSVQVQARLRRYYRNNNLSGHRFLQLPSNCMSYGRDTVICTIQTRHNDHNDFSTLSKKRISFGIFKLSKLLKLLKLIKWKPPKIKPPKLPKPPKLLRPPKTDGKVNKYFDTKKEDLLRQIGEALEQQPADEHQQQ